MAVSILRDEGLVVTIGGWGRSSAPKASETTSRRGVHGDAHDPADGQRTVTTTEGDIASQEWSIPGPQTA
jgi:hypothetical protein